MSDWEEFLRNVWAAPVVVPVAPPVDPATTLPGVAWEPPTVSPVLPVAVSEAAPDVDPALQMIIDFEESGKFAPKPYLDPVGTPTQGYGSIWIWNSAGWKVGRVAMDSPEIDQATANMWLQNELIGVVRAIAADVKVPLTADQHAALEDFIYNLGSGAFEGSTLLKKLNAGDYAGAAAEFEKWDHAGGVEMAGLLRRRKAEVDLWNKA